MTKEEAEALVARERPRWRMVDVVGVNDESGPSVEVTMEGEGRKDGRVVAERLTTDERDVGHEDMEIIARLEHERGAWGIDEA